MYGLTFHVAGFSLTTPLVVQPPLMARVAAQNYLLDAIFRGV